MVNIFTNSINQSNTSIDKILATFLFIFKKQLFELLIEIKQPIIGRYFCHQLHSRGLSGGSQPWRWRRSWWLGYLVSFLWIWLLLLFRRRQLRDSLGRQQQRPLWWNLGWFLVWALAALLMFIIQFLRRWQKFAIFWNQRWWCDGNFLRRR